MKGKHRMLLTTQQKHANACLHFTAETVHRINTKEIQQVNNNSFVFAK